MATPELQPVLVPAEVPNVTQQRYPWRATVRTAFAALVALAALAPLIYSAAVNGSAEGATGAAAGVLAVCAGITRVMALPGVEAFLQRFLPFLAAVPREDPASTSSLQAARDHLQSTDYGSNVGGIPILEPGQSIVIAPGDGKHRATS